MNPFTAALAFLRGDDLKYAAPAAQPGTAQLPQPQEIEEKYGFTSASYAGGWPLGVLAGDPGYAALVAAARVGILVHGPGATEIHATARGGAYGADGNSAVFACLNKLCAAAGEPPLRVYRGDREGGEPEAVPNHPLEELVAAPNPATPGPALWYWVRWAKYCAGNAYLRKVRAPAGNVVELWPLPAALVEPYTTEADWERSGHLPGLISGYRYEYEPGKYEDLAPADVVHFRFGLDQADPRRGCSPVYRLVREVYGDELANQWTAALLGNGGAAGLVVEPHKEANLTRDQALELEQRLAQKMGGSNRGATVVMSPGSSLKQFGFSPEQMDLTALHRLPEERVSAVTGVPAIVAGLGAGLDRATYANFAQALEALTTTTLVPQWVDEAATLTQQLLPDFAGPNYRAKRLFCRFDTSNVQALQEDETTKYERLNKGVLGGWIAPNEARRDVGLPEEPDLDGILYVPTSVAPTPLPDVGNPPEPAPMAPQGGGNGDDAEEAQQADEETEDAQAAEAAKVLTRLIATKAQGRRAKPGDFPALFRALAAVAEPSLERDLADYFDGQRARVMGRLLAQDGAGGANPATARAALPKTNGTNGKVPA